MNDSCNKSRLYQILRTPPDRAARLDPAPHFSFPDLIKSDLIRQEPVD